MKPEFRVKIIVQEPFKDSAKKIEKLLSEKVLTHNVTFYSNFFDFDRQLKNRSFVYNPGCFDEFDAIIIKKFYHNREGFVQDAKRNNKLIRILQ